MGARLVGEVFAYRVDVPLHANEFSLLVAMAHTALDGAPNDGREARRYFDSREAMCFALGRRVVDQDDPKATHAEKAERASVMEFVRRALNGLIALGAIEQDRHGRAGQRAEFRIILDLARTRATAEYTLRLDAQSRRRRQARANMSKARPNAGAGAEPNAGAGAEPNAGAGAEPNAGAGAKEPLRNHRGKTTGNTAHTSTASLASVGRGSISDEGEEAA